VSLDLIDTLLSIHSVTLPLNHLKTAVVQISIYYQRFKNRLKSTHAVHLKQCLALIQGLISVSEDWQAASESSKISRPREELLRVNDLLSRLKGGADQVNIVELVRYLKDSHLAQKISGYAEKTATEAAQAGEYVGQFHLL
jgi:chromosome transmission fidelity protein 1